MTQPAIAVLDANLDTAIVRRPQSHPMVRVVVQTTTRAWDTQMVLAVQLPDTVVLLRPIAVLVVIHCTALVEHQRPTMERVDQVQASPVPASSTELVAVA